MLLMVTVDEGYNLLFRGPGQAARHAYLIVSLLRRGWTSCMSLSYTLAPGGNALAAKWLNAAEFGVQLWGLLAGLNCGADALRGAGEFMQAALRAACPALLSCAS